jgi:hypothetical protein
VSTSKRPILGTKKPLESVETAQQSAVFATHRSISEKEAAIFIGVSVSALRKSRMNGARDKHLPPPPFIQLGRRVVYLTSDLIGYINQHRVDFG